MTAARKVTLLVAKDKVMLDNGRIATDPRAQLFVKSWLSPMQRFAPKSATCMKE